MIAKVFYDDGRIDVFDADHLTDAAQIPGCLLANWSLDLQDAREGRYLLLSLYWYAPAGTAKGAGPKGLPIARRRDDFSFVLADRNDLPHVNMATLDGQVVLMRVAGELVDCTRFGHVSRLADSFVAQERSAYRYLATAAGDDVSEEELCEAMGMAPETGCRISQLFEALCGE